MLILQLYNKDGHYYRTLTYKNIYVTPYTGMFINTYYGEYKVKKVTLSITLEGDYCMYADLEEV